MHSLLIKLFILCLASHQLEATGAANRSSNPHLATFIVKHENKDFVFHHLEYVRNANTHKTCKAKYHTDNSGFTLDWAKCGLTKASDLAHAEMRLKFVFTGMLVERNVYFKDIGPDVMEHSFNGGKVQILFPFNGMEKPILSASPGTMKFTVVSIGLKKAEFKLVKIDLGEAFAICEGELLADDPDGNLRFSVNWAKCGVKKIIDLLRIRIHLKYDESGYEFRIEPIVKLDVPYADLGHYFKGGEAIIELPLNGAPKVYLKGSARPNSVTNRSKNPHLATFIVKNEDEEFVFNHVFLVRNAKTHKTCTAENLSDKSGFTLDWAKCGFTKADDLAHAQICIKFGFAGMLVEKNVDFEDIGPAPDVLEHSFNGGKVQISFPFNGMEKPILSVIKEEDSDVPESSGHQGHDDQESLKPQNENLHIARIEETRRNC